MWKVTRQGDYAVRAVLALATKPGEVVTTREIARSMDIPEAFLVKVVKALVKAGIVESVRGSRGGLKLAGRPEDLTLRHVLEAMEGPLVLNQCLLRPGACDRQPRCPVHPVWKRAQGALLAELERASFAELAALEAQGTTV